MTTVRPAPVREGLLEGRLKRLCALRAAVAGVGLVTFLVSGYRSTGFQPLTLAQFHLLAGAALVNVIYLGLLRTTLDRRALLMAQFVIDVLTISGIVFVASPWAPHTYFYFAVVLLAAIFLGPRASMGFAAFSGVLFGSLAFIYYWISVAVAEPTLVKLPTVVKLRELMSSDDLDPFRKPEFVLQAVLFVGALHVVAWLAGRLAEEISRVRILNDEILVNMSGGVIAVDRTGGVVFANPQATELLAIRDGPTRLTGRAYADVLPPDIVAIIRRGLQERGRFQQELRVGERPLEISISQLADGRGGGIRGAVAIINDLTLRQQMERVTERAERFRALLEMSAGIAHEIRNPLASIRGAAQELDASALPGEDDRRLMQVVLRESDRLDKIVSEFLEYASDRPVDLALFNVPELLQEVATLLRARGEGKGSVVSIDSPGQLVAKGAPDQLKQVFLNLGLNALEAGGPEARVNIRCAPATSPLDPRPGIKVEFEDNGPGIPKEDMKRLFSPFFTTKARGTGMGLAIARKIVTAHGGTITLDSAPGQGTTARVWIPAS